MSDEIFLVNMEGVARRIKAKEMAKVLKMEKFLGKIVEKDVDLIKFAEEVIENGVEYKNESKIVSIFKR